MPSIIDYEQVLERLTADGLVCNYHNSGAFAFPRGTTTEVVAWIGPEDPTIRPEMRPLIRTISAPWEVNLAATATRFWKHRLPGAAWAMPMSHWAYELEFGSSGWMPGLLSDLAVPVEDLQGRNNASAVQFLEHEEAGFDRLLQGLLEHLDGSDFMLAFPDRPVLCMVHHHKQLWWMCSDASMAADLRAMSE